MSSNVFPRTSILRSQIGVSLIEVLIAVGVLGIVSLGFANLVSNTVRQTSALSQKFAAMELEKLLLQVLSDGTICTSVLTQPAARVFNANNPSSEILLQALPASAAANAPDLISVGGLVSPLSSSLHIDKISIQNFRPTGSVEQWMAEIVLSFKSGIMVHQLAPIRIRTYLTTLAGSPANAKQILNCSLSTGGGHQIMTFQSPGSHTFRVPDGVSWVLVEVVGAGGGGAGTDGNLAGGGGGAGGYGRAWVSVVPGSDIPVTVGSPGAGGVWNAAGHKGSGAPGTLSSFGSTLLCSGGAGGISDSTNSIGAGGQGGQCVGATISIPGSMGGDGNPTASLTQGGAGAPSFLGGGGRTSAAAGVHAVVPGSGGGGAWGVNPVPGGNGAPGMVIVTF